MELSKILNIPNCIYEYFQNTVDCFFKFQGSSVLIHLAFANFALYLNLMKIFSLLFFLVFFTSCYHKERNCSDFKTGTFTFTYVIDGVEKRGKFIRTEDYNIDYYENKIDSASIRWINDCEFIQTKINPESKSEEKAIHMKILSTTKDSYTFEYSLAIPPTNKKKRVEKGTATRVD